MSYKIHIYDKERHAKYIPSMCELADYGLSPGYLSKDEIERLGDEDYFCSFATDENDTVCCVSYGRFFGIETAAEELRCTVDEIKELFPGVTCFASHLGMSTRPDMRGKGIGSAMMELHKELVFTRADVVLNIVWNRKGEEKAIVDILKKYGSFYLKTVPLYWYNCTDLYCTLCKGRCVCDCDLYYYTKEGFKG